MNYPKLTPAQERKIREEVLEQYYPLTPLQKQARWRHRRRAYIGRRKRLTMAQIATKHGISEHLLRRSLYE